MKKTCTIGILIIIFAVIPYSILKIDNFRKQISNLELSNKKLQDSIKNNYIMEILGYQLKGFPVSNEYKINEIGKIDFRVLKYGNIREHNVYQKIKGQQNKKLIYSNQTSSRFTFEFIPKSTDDNEYEIEMEFLLDGEPINLHATTQIKVIK